MEGQQKSLEKVKRAPGKKKTPAKARVPRSQFWDSPGTAGWVGAVETTAPGELASSLQEFDARQLRRHKAAEGPEARLFCGEVETRLDLLGRPGQDLKL